jgi:AraC family transcriptional regulator
MSLQTIERPALDVVGLAIRTRPLSPEIPALWPAFMARLDEIERPLEPGVSYGVMRYEEGATPVLHYLAAVSVSSSGQVPEGMTRQTLPAGTYARFSYPLSRLGQGFDEIYNRLLPASPFVSTEGHFFERYNESFDPDNPESVVEIYIPVRRR